MKSVRVVGELRFVELFKVREGNLQQPPHLAQIQEDFSSSG